jgi:hypothetical protein
MNADLRGLEIQADTSTLHPDRANRNYCVILAALPDEFICEVPGPDSDIDFIEAYYGDGE